MKSYAGVSRDKRDAITPLHEATITMFRKIVLLWELARSEGHEDSNDGDGISLEMFVSSQLAILALKGIINPSENNIKAIRRATKDFDELLDFPDIEIKQLDLESADKFEASESEHFRLQNGLWHVRSRNYGEVDEWKKAVPKLQELLNQETKVDKVATILSDTAHLLTDLIWQDYAKLGYVFYCYHYNDKYDNDFGLFDFRYEFSDYFKRNLFTPSWAEVYIDFADSSHEFEVNWNEWGDGCLENLDGPYGNNNLLLLYAHNLEISEDYLTEESGDWYWPEISNLDEIDPEIRIIQCDPRWYFDDSYYNIIDFGVTPDLKFIRELELERGISYAELSTEQIARIIYVLIENLESSEIGTNKVAHYILSLILSHPKTTKENKATIALLSDPHIQIFKKS